MREYRSASQRLRRDAPSVDALRSWPSLQRHHLQHHSATERRKRTENVTVTNGAAEGEGARAVRLWRTPLLHLTCVSSLTLGHAAKTRRKSTTANPQEMSSCAIITWFFRLNLSAPLSPRCHCQFKRESSLTQTWTADFARPPYALEAGDITPADTREFAWEEARNPGPVKYERDHINEAREPRLHHTRGSKPAACGHPRSTARFRSRSSTCDAQFPKTNTTAASTTKSIPAVRPVWRRSAVMCRAFGRRSHDTQVENTETEHSRWKCRSAVTASSGRLCKMWYYQIPPRKSLQSLSGGYRK